MKIRTPLRLIGDWATDRPRWTYSVNAKAPGRKPVMSPSNRMFFTRRGADYDARVIVEMIRAKRSDIEVSYTVREL